MPKKNYIGKISRNLIRTAKYKKDLKMKKILKHNRNIYNHNVDLMHLKRKKSICHDEDA